MTPKEDARQRIAEMQTMMNGILNDRDLTSSAGPRLRPRLDEIRKAMNGLYEVAAIDENAPDEDEGPESPEEF